MKVPSNYAAIKQRQKKKPGEDTSKEETKGKLRIHGVTYPSAWSAAHRPGLGKKTKNEETMNENELDGVVDPTDVDEPGGYNDQTVDQLTKIAAFVKSIKDKNMVQAEPQFAELMADRLAPALETGKQQVAASIYGRPVTNDETEE